MLGQDLRIYIDGTVIAGAKSCDITLECSTIEVTSPGTGDYRAYVPGRKKWEVGTSWLVRAIDAPMLAVGTVVRLTFAAVDGGQPTQDRLSGNAIVTTCKVTATRGRLATGSFKFKGISKLEHLTAQLTASGGERLQDNTPAYLKSILV